jgi:hypothetical protein
VRDWIKHLKREAGPLHGTLQLPDGTVVRYESEEMLDAVLVAIDDREHRLLPCLRQIPTGEGMPGIVRAIEGSGDGVS